MRTIRKPTNVAVLFVLTLAMLAWVILGCGPADVSVQGKLGTLPVAEPTPTPTDEPTVEPTPEPTATTAWPQPTPAPTVCHYSIPDRRTISAEEYERLTSQIYPEYLICGPGHIKPTPRYPDLKDFSIPIQELEDAKAKAKSEGRSADSVDDPVVALALVFDSTDAAAAAYRWLNGRDYDDYGRYFAINQEAIRLYVTMPTSFMVPVSEMERFIRFDDPRRFIFDYER